MGFFFKKLTQERGNNFNFPCIKTKRLKEFPASRELFPGNSHFYWPMSSVGRKWSSKHPIPFETYPDSNFEATFTGSMSNQFIMLF